MAPSVNPRDPAIRTIVLFSGELNVEGTELAGAWTQSEVSLPLTFTRAAATDGPR